MELASQNHRKSHAIRIRNTERFGDDNGSYTLPKQWRSLAEYSRKLLTESCPLLTLPTSSVPRSISRMLQSQSPTPARRGNDPSSEAIEIDSAFDNESRLAPTSESISNNKKRINNGDLSRETPVTRQRIGDISLYTQATAIDKA